MATVPLRATPESIAPVVPSIPSHGVCEVVVGLRDGNVYTFSISVPGLDTPCIHDGTYMPLGQQPVRLVTAAGTSPCLALTHETFHRVTSPLTGQTHYIPVAWAMPTQQVCIRVNLTLYSE